MICDYWGVLIMERGRLFITQTAEECAVVQWDEWKTSCVDAVCVQVRTETTGQWLKFGFKTVSNSDVLLMFTVVRRSSYL